MACTLCERRQQHAYCEKGAYILLEREGSTHAVCEKRNEPCLLIEPGKWWSELEEANAHMLAHVFTSRCMHTACRHTGVTAHWCDVTGTAPLYVWVRLPKALFLVAYGGSLGSLGFFFFFFKGS